MRLSTIAGVVLIIAGAFTILWGGSFTSRRDVVRIGGMSVSAVEQHPIQPWLGGLVLGAGVLLLVTGVRRKA